jgi:pimeloyl-ACP methyl ester carboxylesterase
MRDCPQGLAAFLRAYFHCKSGDWAGNQPFPLRDRSAEELAKMPGYYIMDLGSGMAETVAAHAPSEEEIAACSWLPEAELRVYAQEFARTGFQGGLQWYRCIFDAGQARELCLYSGRSIDVPACFIAGEKDWGVYQQPGALEAMRDTACSRMQSVDLVPGAGHWVQQERPEAVAELLLRFLASLL